MKGAKFLKAVFVFAIILLNLFSCSQESLLDTNEPEPWPPFPLEIGNRWQYKYDIGDTISAEDSLATILEVSIVEKFYVDKQKYYQLECCFLDDSNSQIYYYALCWDESDSTLYRYQGDKDKLKPIMAFDCSFDNINKEIFWGRCKSKLVTCYYNYNGFDKCRFYKIAELPAENSENVVILKAGIGFVFDSTFGELKNYKIR